MKLINCLWLGGKHSVNKQILYCPADKGGVGLKNLNFLVAASKISDMFSLLNSLSDKKELLSFKKSQVFKKFKNFLLQKQIYILEFSLENFKLVNCGNVIDPMSLSCSQLYKALMLKNYQTENLAEKISKFYPDLELTDKFLIFKFLTKIWNHKRLTPLDKNILYLFFLKSYLDKPTKWAKNAVDHPFCYFCKKEPEFMQHLLFDCENSLIFKETFSFMSIKDILQFENIFGLKYIVAKLISSWCQETSEYLKKLGSIPKE